jgi:4-hydroxy-tetrahydrodipicolinate reductase
MKIALIGYGNMGQEIQKLVTETKEHQIVSISYEDPKEKLDEIGISKSDVVIDFSSPEIVLSTIKVIAKMKKNMVVGTTGWYKNIPQVKDLVKKSDIGLIYGQNFSIGANILFKITAYASRLFNKYGNYDVYGFEIHHKGKKDSPSGTARKLSETIIENFPQKTVIQNERINRKIENQELHFASIRGGFNPGLHEVIFDSAADEIRLTHYARGRRGFAEGAILAAEFIKGKKGFFDIDQLFA